jgi:hypothetical protein
MAKDPATVRCTGLIAGTWWTTGIQYGPQRTGCSAVLTVPAGTGPIVRCPTCRLLNAAPWAQPVEVARGQQLARAEAEAEERKARQRQEAEAEAARLEEIAYQADDPDSDIAVHSPCFTSARPLLATVHNTG